MKKLITLLLSMSVAVAAFSGVSDRYGEGFEYRKSDKLEGKESYALSPYKDGTYVFIQDGQVYVTRIDTAGGDLDIRVCPDFAQVKPTGLVAYDGKRNRLYYSDSYAPYGMDYLFESIPDQNGVWQKGVRMRIRGTVRQRGEVNFVQSAGWNFEDKVPGGFYNPVMSPDGDRVYFSSPMEGGKGGRDIFYVEMENETDRVWGFPVNDSTVNTAGDDDWMAFESDTVRYVSSDKTGVMKIYKSVLRYEDWAEPLALAQPFNAAMANYNLQVYDGAPVQVSTRDGAKALYLYLPVPEVEPEPEDEPEPEPTYEEKKRKFYWVFFLFDFNKDILDEKFLTDLNSLYNEMLQFPDAVFEISGYTDSRGAADYNDKLSQRRADTIRELLVEKGFPADRLKAVGYGERRLQVPDAQTEEEHAQNRRVEVRIVMDEEK